MGKKMLALRILIGLQGHLARFKAQQWVFLSKVTTI